MSHFWQQCKGKSPYKRKKSEGVSSIAAILALLVYRSLEGKIGKELHALAIRTFIPSAKEVSAGS